jgi:type II secretory pathway predicted ATPase ExeA
MASPRTQFYHAAREIDGALKGIERCIRRAEGVGLVVGSPGTGKSLLLLKLAELVRDDFDVALLTGASVCTRRALWQSILAAIGEPYRGLDETELRIAIVERIRGLAATGSGLVILVDEAHTLPTRLIEELRLLTNVPTPLPAVHIVLAGTARLDELLGAPRMESLAQRVAVRGHLEPLDHAETLAYLRTQVKAAGLEWDRLFAAGCDDAIYRATEGVPRLINQVCDQALVAVAESDRRVTAADIASAWRDIQRLPLPVGLEPRPDARAPLATGGEEPPADLYGEGFGVIEFGADDVLEQAAPPAGGQDAATLTAEPATDPWSGPDVELVFDGGSDPFEAFFERDAAGNDRPRTGGAADFGGCRPVASREGQSLGKLLATVACDVGRPQPAAVPNVEHVEELDVIDDSDMIVIEEDLCESPSAPPTVSSVRPSDYRSLFTRLRRARG